MGEAAFWSYHGTDHFWAQRAKFIPPGSGGEAVARLHLGCGNKRFRGYQNIDVDGTPDLVCDITALPHAPETIEEILAVHVFEHLFPWKSEAILKHWYEKLKPGGKLILEMPDLKKVLEFFKLENPPPSHTMFALYGGEKSERAEDTHKWCWSFAQLEPLLKTVGFTEVVEKPAVYHVPERDFRVEATK